MRNRILAFVFGAGLLGCGIWLAIYFVGKNRADAELEGLKDAYVEVVETEGRSAGDNPEGNLEAGKQNAAKGNGEDGAGNEGGGEENDGKKNGGNGRNGISGNGLKESIQVTDDLSGFSVPDKKIDFSALQKENPDIYSWITIPGTPIDYPVLQDEEELDYYLMHNLNGSYGYPGCIYTQYYNAKDWMDNNTVIYGHNMKDGSMFTALHHYQEREFFEENPYVYIYSPDEIMVYKIFAAYETSDVHLLLAFDTESTDSWEWYLKGITENEEGAGSHFDRTLALEGKDKIISMETCISSKPHRRYLVQAVLVARAESK